MPDKQPINQVIEIDNSSDNLDYASLRKTALELSQKLSGNIWTDYNLHDPGITILESLCFALTDLSYRTNFSIQDILTDKSGQLDYHNNSFYTIDEILATSPANLNDFKKIILDRIDEIQDLEFKSTYTDFDIKLYRGVYDVYVQIKSIIFESILSLEDENYKSSFYRKIENKIRDIILKERFIGFELDNIVFLLPKEIHFSTNILINKDVDAEQILANIYFELINYFNPFIKFESPIDLYNNSKSLEEIFDGPTLSKGIIQNDAFLEAQSELNSNDLIILIKNIPGIEEVKSFSFLNSDKKDDPYTISINSNQFFQLNHLSKRNSVQLFKDQYEVNINKQFFDNLCKEKFNAQSKSSTYEIDIITKKNLTGNYRNISLYYSIQNYFPIIYGLGVEGVSKNEGAIREASLKQLKAFILVFEQIMANYLSQLNATKQLFSNIINSENDKTYFSQKLNGITGLKEILVFFNNINASQSNYLDEEEAFKKLMHSLDKIAETDAEFVDRKNAFLDHMLARFNISLNHLPVDLHEMYYKSKVSYRVNNTLFWKSSILQNVLGFTKNRFKYPNYLIEPQEESVNYLSVIYKLLYINSKPFDSLIESFNASSSKIQFELNNNDEEIKNQKLVLIDDIIPVIDNNKLYSLDKIQYDNNVFVFEFQNKTLFIDSIKRNNYKISPDIFGSNKTLILFKSNENENWRVIARVENEQEALEKISSLISFFVQLNKSSEGIHILEHVLLRPLDSNANFGFRLKELTTNLVLFKTSEFKSLQETNSRFIKLKHILCDVDDVDEEKKINLIIDTLSIVTENDFNWEIIMKALKSIFINKKSIYKIEFFILANNGEEIETDYFDFKVSFVIPNWPARFQDIRFVSFLKDIIIEHLPAHIEPIFHFIDFNKMIEFEKNYFPWIKLLHDRSSNEFNQLSTLLTSFVYNCDKN